ncbi:MAG: hypothetical protein LBT49_02545 [Prevotellaceae bacterium]|nr:hypothetical protein [Prevotellaceae bacterium]
MKTNAIRLLTLVLFSLPACGLSAQNTGGITLSNYKAQAGPDGRSSTLTIDIRWTPPADSKKVWSDTVWVFVDYNNKGKMDRLPLSTSAAKLTNPSWSGASVIEEPGNRNGVWVAGNARSNGSFSATLQLPATCKDARPCVATGVCVYAINYPPVGRYTAYNQIHFTGTPPFYVTYKEGGDTVVQDNLAKPFTVPAGKAVVSFYDASLAPGMITCKPPVVQTLSASADNYCVGSPDVTLALSSTEHGAVYRLYKDNAAHSVLTGTGNPMPFPGSFGKGAYSARVVAGAFCEKPMNGAPVVKDERKHPAGSTTDFPDFDPCTGGVVPGAFASSWTLRDTRENGNEQSYKVRLMHDGHYWMVQDLRFGNQCDKETFKGSTFDQTGSKLTSISGYIYGDCRNNPQSGAGHLYDWAAAIQKPDACYGGSRVGCSGTGSGSSGTNPGACQGICPEGWHIPTLEEFNALHNIPDRACFDNDDNCWNAASPWEGTKGGLCSNSGALSYQNARAIYLSSTYCTGDYAYGLYFHISYVSYGIYRLSKLNGYSVRCVRNY